MRTRCLVLAVGIACLMLAAGAPFGGRVAAADQAGDEQSWVRYRLPATRSPLTIRWQLVGSEGQNLVIKVETYLDGELRATREIRGERLRVPDQYRRETIVAGGKKYDCKVFEVRGTTFWYSEDVPLMGIVRSQTGEHDVMELVDSSGPPRK